MIKTFKLENIKSFSTSQEMNLAPITLIYGQNSSGKSSIIQSLLLLKQTLLHDDETDYLITNDKYLSLGGFKSIVHQHDLKREVNLVIGFEKNYDGSEYYHKNSRKLPFANSAHRFASFSYKSNAADKSNLARLEKFEYAMPEKRFHFRVLRYGGLDSARYRFSQLDEEALKYLSQEAKADLSNDDFRENLAHCDTLNLPAKVVSKKSDRINPILSEFLDDLKDLFNIIKYMGPLRSAPRRIYSSETYSVSQSKGQHNLGLELYKCAPAIIDRINASLHTFEIPYTITVKNIGDDSSGDAISLNLMDLRSGAVITPVDVGFGIGQVLPIILEALVSKKSILCVEQPEIHLHPKLQANLADLFIESANEGNQWIIETHSEALLLRLQKRIRNGEIKKEMVSIIYVDVGASGASALNIPLDNNGDFAVHWPGGFFEERLEEMKG